MLTQARLKELLHYDPETGVFTWVFTTSTRTKVGAVAGCWHNGYKRIKLDGKSYLSHRLAWLYVHGYFPVELDHINGDRGDCRFSNLRDATRSVNQQNLRRPRSNNKSGFLGVSRSFGKWKAQIQVDGKGMHIGQFSTPEEAHAAYLSAKRELHPFQTLVGA